MRHHVWGKYCLLIAVLSLACLGAMGAEISAKVVNKDGNPVGGATVRLYLYTYEDGRFRCASVSETATDDDGTFTVERSALDLTDPNAGDTSLRVEILVASKKGLAVTWAKLFADTPAPETLTLEPPATITGVVLDESGSALGGVEVRAIAMRETGDFPNVLGSIEPMTELCVTTGPDGRFAFDDLPADVAAEFTARAAGRAVVCTVDLNKSRFRYTAGADVRITLPPEALVEGDVVGPDGKSVAGAKVFIHPAARFAGPFSTAAVESDGSGAFRFEGLLPGDYRIYVIDPGEGFEKMTAQPVEVSAEASRTVRANVVLEPAATLQVVVMNLQTSFGIKDANVHVSPSRNDAPFIEARSGRTDLDGVVRLTMPAGAYVIGSVTKEGYQRQASGTAVELKTGETSYAEIELIPTGRIAGVVVDPDGNPVEGVVVRLKTMRNFSAPSDAEGRFEIAMTSQSPAPAEYVIARHVERNLAGVAPLSGAAGGLTVKMLDALTLQGRVIDTEGKPIRGAKVLLCLWLDGMGSSVLDEPLRTDAQGAYTIKAAPREHELSVRASAAGYGSDYRKINFIPEDPGKPIELDAIALAVADQKITGRVVNAEGKGVKGADVGLSGRGQPQLRKAKTGADGSFTINKAVKGTASLGAHVEGQRDLYAQARIEVPTPPVTLTLKRYGSAARSSAPEAAALKGKPLPSLAGIAPDFAAKAEGGGILVCLFDMNQRGGRRTLRDLSAKKDDFTEKGVVVIALDLSGSDAASVNAWAKEQGASFPVVAAGDPEKTRLEFGVNALPWLILADKGHIVRAEGFGTEDLDAKI
ncbi:MAG: carboxypeptidase regulatory-like domain-containing protein, partial [Planctomycetota bacterium]